MQFLNPKFEQAILQTSKYQRIIGLDEVGRGCWAGPTAVGAYIYNLNQDEYQNANDSKLLSQAKRELVFGNLPTENYEVLFGEVKSINELGIGKTIEKLICELILKYRDGKTLFLIDGQHSKNFGVDTLKIIKGDSTYYSIALASIAAKVTRDNLMNELHRQHPVYKFDKHKGYATKLHRDMIDAYGVCVLHRTSFEPIRKILKSQTLL